MNKKRLWVSLWLLCSVVSLAWFVSGCGESLNAQVNLVDTVSENSTTATMVVDKYLYSVQNGKLVVYDISKPEAPKKEVQQDAFKGPHRAMVPFGSGQMMLLGEDGTVQVFDISTPSTPQPIWGAGKTFKLKYSGPFGIRSNPLVMYVSPGNGVAIARIDLGELTKSDAEQSKIDAGTTSIKGGGGGGFYLVRNADSIPVALYIGNTETGKLDYWSVADIEKGEAKAPTASIDVKAGKDISQLYLYQNADNTRGHLMVVSKSGDIEYLNLGNEYSSVARPKTVELENPVSIPNMRILDLKRKRIFSRDLEVYEFDKDFKAPAIWAKTETRAVIEVADMVLHPTKDFIYVAEKAGLRIYSYGAKAN